MGDFNRERVRAGGKSADGEARVLIAGLGGVGVDHLQPAVDVDVRQPGPGIRDADPADAGAGERNRRPRAARVGQRRFASAMEVAGVRVPVAAIRDAWVVLLDSGHLRQGG